MGADQGSPQWLDPGHGVECLRLFSQNPVIPTDQNERQVLSAESVPWAAEHATGFGTGSPVPGCP